MKNSEKFVTAQERAEAFWKWNREHIRANFTAEQFVLDAFAWLDLECEDEKPLPCPFCGSECKLDDLNRVVNCTKCDYMSGGDIAAHNRVAKSASDAKGDK